MNRAKRLYILLGVLVVVCAGAFLALHAEEQQEEIETSGETVFEIDVDQVQELSWTCGDETFAFHRDDTWLYDSDEAFPVDEEKITQLLEQFEAFNAAFVIRDVEDYSQYGLEEAECTIHITTEDQSYEILVGDYSTMDSQRYVSTGDGNVYLAVNDPMDYYDVELSDLIDNDEVPLFDEVTDLTFTGTEDYSVYYQEDSTATYSSADVYFTGTGSDTLPLDTDRVEDYLDAMTGLDLTNYVTYNVTEEQLQTYGLDDPELTVTMDYVDSEDNADTFVLHVSRLPEERNAEETEESDEEEEITAYVRVGESQIVYQITSQEYTSLMAASRSDLRHQQVFWAEFTDIAQIDISLEGEDYTITSEGSGESRTYWYQEEELDVAEIQSAVENLTAQEFTDEKATQQEEISLILHLDSENVPQVSLQFYRYDGSNCLAVVDGQPVCLVARSAVVDLMEAVRTIVLN